MDEEINELLCTLEDIGVLEPPKKRKHIPNIERCQDCKKDLNNSGHHQFCHECWIKRKNKLMEKL